MVFSPGPNEQTKTKQRENINQRRKHHRYDVARDGNEEHKPHNGEKNDGHHHSNAQIRNELAKHEARAAQRTHEQLLERPAFPFANQRHGGSNCRPDLQNDTDHARHKKVRGAHCRVIKHLGANIDRHTLPAGFAQKRFH